jgi:hypothetical protein
VALTAWGVGAPTWFLALWPGGQGQARVFSRAAGHESPRRHVYVRSACIAGSKTSPIRFTIRRSSPHCGICFKGHKISLSHVFAGQNVGVTAHLAGS